MTKEKLLGDILTARDFHFYENTMGTTISLADTVEKILRITKWRREDFQKKIKYLEEFEQKIKNHT